MIASSKKIWLKATYWATKASLEVAQSAFTEMGAIGIEIDDGIGPENQKKYPDDQILVVAYFDLATSTEELERSFAKFFAECGLEQGPLEFSQQEEEAWQENFVRTCKTILVDPDIYVVPSFDEAFKKNPLGPLWIEMDPENAFGTGQHQTTQLCLTHIRKLLVKKPHSSVRNLDCLDIGCGSGILAILMKKLGVRSVLATETDLDALLTAERNARINKVHIHTAHVDEDYEYVQDHYDLAVANILAPVLIVLSENILSSLRTNGELILSGILVPQAPEVIAAYESLGAELLLQDNKDDWCALIFKKTATAG